MYIYMYIFCVGLASVLGTCIYIYSRTTARHLKEIVPLKFLEDGALQLDKVIGDHYCEQSLTVRINSHIQSDSLEQNHDGMENWIQTRQRSREQLVILSNYGTN